MNIINDKIFALMRNYHRYYNCVENKGVWLPELKKSYFDLINAPYFEYEVNKCNVLCELNDSGRIILNDTEWEYVGGLIGTEWSEAGYKGVLDDLGVFEWKGVVNIIDRVGVNNFINEIVDIENGSDNMVSLEYFMLAVYGYGWDAKDESVEKLKKDVYGEYGVKLHVNCDSEDVSLEEEYMRV